MLTQIINGHILTPQGWLKDGSVLISDGKILEVTNSDLAVIGATVIDAKGMYIVPGFISMHAHGGAGYDFTEGSTEAFQKASLAHLKHGATSIFPTLSSTCFENIKQAVKTCEALMKEPGSTIQGLHIEGPYLNKKMAGSQWEEFLKDPDPNEYIPLIESTQCIKRWDISPELPGGHEFGQYMRSKGIMAAITHTEAEYPEIKAAFESGFTHAAHFYNAMPGFHKRREYKYEGMSLSSKTKRASSFCPLYHLSLPLSIKKCAAQRSEAGDGFAPLPFGGREKGGIYFKRVQDFVMLSPVHAGKRRPRRGWRGPSPVRSAARPARRSTR